MGWNIAGQVIGFVAAALLIASFQFKSTKKLFIIQIISIGMFTLHYAFLGIGGDTEAFAGMGQDICGMLIRLLALLSAKHKWAENITWTFLVVAACMGIAAITYSEGDTWICVLPVISNIAAAFAIRTAKANTVRLTQLCVSSPCWIVYNIGVFSLSGILTESLNIISIAVYYIRMAAGKKK